MSRTQLIYHLLHQVFFNPSVPQLASSSELPGACDLTNTCESHWCRSCLTHTFSVLSQTVTFQKAATPHSIAGRMHFSHCFLFVLISGQRRKPSHYSGEEDSLSIKGSVHSPAVHHKLEGTSLVWKGPRSQRPGGRAPLADRGATLLGGQENFRGWLGVVCVRERKAASRCWGV